MKFSIIIPVFNVENYLEKCLSSVLNQTYNNYEVIMVCDKSNDNSEKIVDKFVKKNNNFMKIKKENTGLSIARNIGIDKSTGDYILFLDGDDYFEPNLLEVLHNELIKENNDLIRFQVQEVIFNEIKKYEEIPFESTTGIKAFDKITNYHFIENSWSYCYNSNFFKKNKFYFMENCIAEDFGLTPLIIYKAKSVKSISYIGYNYVKRENSIMNNNNYEMKLKKADDMLKQATYLKSKIDKDNTNKFISFINNSLIKYITTLKYKDYKKYNKYLKKNKFYNHFKITGLTTLKNTILIKCNAYLFYNYLVR